MSINSHSIVSELGARMLAKRLTSIINAPSPGINGKGLPTINVCGDEVALEAYWRILDMAEIGQSKQEIVTHIIAVTASDSPESSARFYTVVDNILENRRLIKAAGTILGVKQVRTSGATGHPKPRKSTVLQKARRVTMHFASSEPTLKSPTSPAREEEKLVVESLQLMAERDALAKVVPDSKAKRRATAAIDQQLKVSLQKHQAADEHQALEDARTRIELARQNLQ